MNSTTVSTSTKTRDSSCNINGRITVLDIISIVLHKTDKPTYHI